MIFNYWQNFRITLSLDETGVAPKAMNILEFDLGA